VARVDLTHHFLIAMPSMADPHFSRTLTFICEHNDQGALGLVVNRPIDMTLAALFERLNLETGARGLADTPVYFGGPVQTDRGFVLHVRAASGADASGARALIDDPARHPRGGRKRQRPTRSS
jgi:putative AlgH/UPF0301 family transcriptional regulator